MSNLIKSGKVVDIETPVNVGVSYTINEASRIVIERAKGTENGAVRSFAPPMNTRTNRGPLTKEGIVAEYIAEAESRANEEYEAIIKKATEEGISNAQNEANKIIGNAHQEYENILDEIKSLKDQALNEYKKTVKDNEKEVVDLALHIAEKILNYEIDKSDNYIVGIVEDAVSNVLSKKDVSVKLATQDYYTIQANKKLLMARVKGFGEIELIQDESLDIGSCLVDTPLGVIDGGLQVRMDNIQKEIQKLLAE